jgi:exosortase
MKSEAYPKYSWEIALLIGGLWILLYRNLAVHWSVTQQYQYGWVVPVLTIYALAARWKRRPSPSAALPIGYWLAGGAALLVFPTWLLLQPNPDWRMLSWLFAMEIVAITLSLVALLGGRAWVNHFLFPFVFVFTAVPWPRPLEIPFVDALTDVVTQIGVEALNITGVGAVLHGNVIELKSGFLGVEEACSGIQSLQATLMASLFFGEFFQLKIGRRAMLAAFGVIAALATNVGRTYFLAWQAGHAGISAVEKWHDTAANLALALCFCLVWARGLIYSSSGRGAASPAPSFIAPNGPPTWFARVLAGWFVAVIVVTELWYYDAGSVRQENWSMIPPRNSRSTDIPKWTAEQLQADEAIAAKWDDEMGYQWQLYFFRWKAGPVRSRLLARLHRPETCLPAIGLKLVARRGEVPVHTEAFQISFHAYRFDQNGTPLFVYWGAWEDRSTRALQKGSLSESLPTAAFQSVAWRERNLGQQVAELAISGCTDAQDADAALQRMVLTLLSRVEH